MPVDWTHDFVDTEDRVPFQLAPPDAFARRAGELGTSDGDLVVTCDDYYGLFAGRLAWAFRCYGAEARVLDGGWRTWGRGGPTDTNHPRGVYAGRSGQGAGAAGAVSDDDLFELYDGSAGETRRGQRADRDPD